MAKKKSSADKKSSKKSDTSSGKKSNSSGKNSAATEQAADLLSALRLPEGPVVLGDVPSGALSIGPKDKESAEKALADLGPDLASLQEKLFAESTAGGRRSVLLLLQGMDTAGKDGVIEHVVGLLNPGGLKMASFKSPTAEELKHDFLWRIEQQVPVAGQIGIFNRSQYEDVLIVRVHDLVGRDVWSKRYAQINAFERDLKRAGVTLIKCFLHVSKDVQAERLAARLDDPNKYWKYNPADVDERARWDDYQTAYADALRKCSTVGTPWYVIPSDKKWYRNWAVAALLRQVLGDLDPEYPKADFDIDEQKQRLAEG